MKHTYYFNYMSFYALAPVSSQDTHVLENTKDISLEEILHKT